MLSHLLVTLSNEYQPKKAQKPKNICKKTIKKTEVSLKEGLEFGEDYDWEDSRRSGSYEQAN